MRSVLRSGTGAGVDIGVSLHPASGAELLDALARVKRNLSLEFPDEL